MNFDDILKCDNIVIIYNSLKCYQESLYLLDHIRMLNKDTVYKLFINEYFDPKHVNSYIYICKKLHYDISKLGSLKLMYSSNLILEILNDGTIILHKSRYTNPNENFNVKDIYFFQRKDKIKKILKNINQ